MQVVQYLNTWLHAIYNSILSQAMITLCGDLFRMGLKQATKPGRGLKLKDTQYMSPKTPVTDDQSNIEPISYELIIGNQVMFLITP